MAAYSPRGHEIQVKGLREFLIASGKADRATKRLIREPLRKAVEPVRDEARRLFMPFSAKSAMKYGISVRQKGTITVEQRLRKTTGEHPEWGALQMREALLPALEDQEEHIRSRMEQAVDQIADNFEHRRMG